MNVIKQIVKDGQYGTQTIKMIVKDGERGPQGIQGEPGVAATIDAGQAYSVPSTQQPAVVNTGSPSAVVLDFYIPKGQQGEQGEKGDMGERGPQGLTGERGPQGPKGDRGTDGKDGAIQYSAGTGINITPGNVIEATGAAVASWGGIIGDINNQTDLQTELGKCAKTASLASVATSGSYNDLSNKPTIPAAQVNSDWGATSGIAEILNKPTLATVATSGSYNDLSNRPTIPTVNNATLTIQQNGTSVATFTANSATNATANIATPVITMTDTDPGEGSPLAANHYLAVYDTVPISDDYSTNEVATSRKWINGARVYKKTIDFGALPNNTAKTVDHAIQNLNLIIDFEAFAYGLDGTKIPIPYIADTSANNIRLLADNYAVEIITGADRTNMSAYVTLYYTKTT